MKIKYPSPLQKGDRIAVSAISSGVEKSLHILLEKAKENVESQGYKVGLNDTDWNERKARSASKEVRAEEFMSLLSNPTVNTIIPPWGGEFSMEVLPRLDWEKIKELPPTWILGYSDISTICFVYTTATGNASAHGTNFIELSAPRWDELSGKWMDVLSTSAGERVSQYSSSQYQSSWQKTFAYPGTGFYFDQKTVWKNLSGRNEERFSGRLVGGIMNTLQVIIGTPFDHVEEYIASYTINEGTIWFLESVEMSSAEIYRSLWQMKNNGWFKNTTGILLGRASGYTQAKDFMLEDALREIFAEEGIQVFYDVDIGHMPPQNILVNGAYAEVSFNNGSGKIDMHFI
ncbi:S66 family peptidase [Cytobacillus purgationiresistens]|uniref:Muramoyltetrapeptide carboxypeptidase LdcA involved in peptidoglycan recycling n=1 Tax=Cytobacillus purgationiresistens TaxID=863449 RepID=A0ABU0AK55_9BACI|nr:S66 peptidase family protein [Cytobacillus purgationiresistens]MDQ0271425.1 muramoyltetrapeptide carboxypeptidase LdcA involved in peptidoglycan recycling [Cytobacillus purgationiresistens]